MKILTKILELDKSIYYKALNLNDNSAFLIDIETTGFSSTYQIIYLIGLIFIEDDQLILKQWFVEKEADEYQMLYELAKFITHYKVVVHYNGTNFDMPFIKTRMDLYHIKHNLDDLYQQDIYIALKTIKAYLPLENLKLKTVEAYFNFIRKDTFSGGELIEYFKSYQESPSPEVLESLLLHNEEDLLSLYICLHSLDLVHYFNNLRKVTDINIKDIFINQSYVIIDIEKTTDFELKLSLPYYTIYINHHILSISIPIITDELKFFFDDFENYYYLLKEDYAVHKSIGKLVEAKYRKKAKKSNCYTKKRGNFIPLLQDTIEGIPLYYKFYQTKPAYIELNDHFLKENGHLNNYIQNILSNL